MGITEQHKAEMLSLAYLNASCARAGLIVAQFNLDYGVDAQIANVVFDPVTSRRRQSGASLRVQLKATKRWSTRDSMIVYDLEAKTYNDLISERNALTPLVLVVLCMPNNGTEPFGWSPEELFLRECSYWWIPEQGGQITAAKNSKRIMIPATQQLTPYSLRVMVDGVNEGNWP